MSTSSRFTFAPPPANSRPHQDAPERSHHGRSLPDGVADRRPNLQRPWALAARSSRAIRRSTRCAHDPEKMHPPVAAQIIRKPQPRAAIGKRMK